MYQRDLAYIHDTGFTGFVTKAAPGLLRMLRQNRIHGGLVVDAGCGSGVWARKLSEAGYAVLGIDISASMIGLARKQAPAATFVVESFFQAKLPRCDAVTSIGECVNYAFDPRSGKPALVRFFHRVYDALRPGGLFIFDVVEPGIDPDGTPQRKFSEGPDWAILLEVQEDRKHGILTRRISSFRQVGRLYRRSDELHSLHLFPRAELQVMLSQAGFQVRTLSGYGRLRFAPAHVGFLVRKAS